MLLHYFSGEQNNVFLVALTVLLVAVIPICLPIAFWPDLQKRYPKRPRKIAAVIIAAGTVILIGSIPLFLGGFRTLADERVQVQTVASSAIGVALSAEHADVLVNGGTVALKFAKGTIHVSLLPTGTDRYGVWVEGPNAVVGRFVLR